MATRNFVSLGFRKEGFAASQERRERIANAMHCEEFAESLGPGALILMRSYLKMGENNIFNFEFKDVFKENAFSKKFNAFSDSIDLRILQNSENPDKGALSELLTRKGDFVRRNGGNEEACKLYQEALRNNPENAGTYRGMGYALFGLKRYNEALDYLNKSLEIEPNNADAWRNRGCTLRRLHKYREAVSSFNRALALNSDCVLAAYGNFVSIFKLEGGYSALKYLISERNFFRVCKDILA